MSNHGGSRPGSGRKASGRVGITLRLSSEAVERLDRIDSRFPILHTRNHSSG